MRKEYDFSRGKRGAVNPTRGKTRISIYIDNAVLDGFRALAERRGIGYQTMMNEVLRRHLDRSAVSPLTKEHVRDVLREEMPLVLRELMVNSGVYARARGKRPAR